MSVNDNGTTSLYINNRFVINNNNIKLISKSLALRKEFFVNEDHIMLMMCKSGNFNTQLIEKKDDIEMEIKNIIIPVETKKKKQSYLSQPIRHDIKNLDFNEKKRQDLKVLIKNQYKNFDPFLFIDSITTDTCTQFLPSSVTYCYYSLPKGHPKKVFFLKKKKYTNY